MKEQDKVGNDEPQILGWTLWEVKPKQVMDSKEVMVLIILLG